MYACLQPEYMGKFQCDGAACGSQCCRNWLVGIDPITYQKYCGIEPKSERDKILSHIKYNREMKTYAIEMDPTGGCPFLEENGLCHIQKTRGASWLSNICTLYPRKSYLVGDMLLRGLSMACPVAARTALLPEEPMAFEMIDLSQEQYEEIRKRNSGILGQFEAPLLDIHYGAVSILQNRGLSIDQRLIVLGFFLDQAGDFAAAGETEKIAELSSLYASDNFMEQVPDMLSAIVFQPDGYIRSLFGLIEALYGKNAKFHGRERDLMIPVLRAFGVKEEVVSIAALTETYKMRFRPAEERMLREYGHILENYLVNEFFLYYYPDIARGTFAQNYILLVIAYKLITFMAVSLTMAEDTKPDGEWLVGLIGHMAASFDHNVEFLRTAAQETMKRHKDVVSCMKDFLVSGTER